MSVTAAYRNCVMHINITWTQNESGILSETRTGTQAKYTRSYIKCHICIRMALSWFASHSHMTFKHSPNHIEHWFGSNLIATIAFYLPFKSDQFKHIVMETFLRISLFFRHSSRCRMPIAELILRFWSPKSGNYSSMFAAKSLSIPIANISELINSVREKSFASMFDAQNKNNGKFKHSSNVNYVQYA